MRYILPLLAMAIFIPHAASAQPAHAKKDKSDKHRSEHYEHKHAEDYDAGHVILDTVFTELEKELIGDYFSGNHDDDVKHKGLPPGLQKHLARNGTLPPGLQGRDLPPGLAKRLPHREGTQRVIVGNDVVLLQKGTRLILDIIRDVIKAQ